MWTLVVGPIVWVATVVFAAWTAGRVLVGEDGPATWTERVALPWAVGLAAGTLGAFLLAAVGLYRPAVIVPTVSLVAVAGLPRALRDLRGAPRPGGAIDPLAVLAFVVLLVHLPRCFDPGLAWDSMVYHLPIPQHYLANAGMVVMSWNFNAAMPHNPELLYGVALAGGGLPAAKLVAWQHDLLCVALLVGAARRLGVPHLGGAMGLAYLATPDVLRFVGTTYTELSIGAALTAAWVAVLPLGEPDAARLTGRRASVVGLLLGWAMGMKYTAWFYAAAVVVAVAVDGGLRTRESWRDRLGPAAVVGGAAGLAVSPWLLRHAWVLGNPVWPNAYRVFGGRWWSEELAMQLFHKMSFHRAYGVGQKNTPTAMAEFVVQVVTDPRAVGGVDGFSAVAWALFLLSPLALIGHPHVRRWAFALLAPWLALGVFLVMPVPNDARYLLPVVPWMAIGAGAVLSRLPALGWARVLMRVAVAVALLAPLPWPEVDLSVMTPDGHAEATRRLGVRRTSTALERWLPVDSKTWFAFENRLVWLDREAWCDSLFDAPATFEILRREGGAAGLAAYLADHGTTHVVVHERYARNYLTRRITHPIVDDVVLPPARFDAERAEFERFVVRHLVLVHRVGELTVYRLDADGSEPTAR